MTKSRIYEDYSFPNHMVNEVSGGLYAIQPSIAPYVCCIPH